MAAEQCSVCRAFPHADGTPSCECAPRHPDETGAAGADSFRPLRVRPYFSPEGTDTEDPAPAEPVTAPPPYGALPDVPLAPARFGPGSPGHLAWVGPKSEDVDLFEGTDAGTGAGAGAGPGTGAGAEPGPWAATGPGAGAGPGAPLVPAQRTGEADDDPVGLVVLRREEPTRAERRRQARRRKGPIAIAAVAVLGVGAAVFATGLIGGDDTSDDNALPDPTKAAPTAPAHESEEPGTTSASPTRSGSGSASAKPSGSGSSKASRRTASGSPTRIGGEITTAPRPTATGGGPDSRPRGPRTLRPGDSGAEVEELQNRLKQLYVFYITPADGEYDSDVSTWVSQFQRDEGIKGDQDGVYGPHTRRALEAATEEP